MDEKANIQYLDPENIRAPINAWISLSWACTNWGKCERAYCTASILFCPLRINSMKRSLWSFISKDDFWATVGRPPLAAEVIVHVFVATAPREFNSSLKIFGKRINDWKLSCSPSVYTNSEFQLLTWFWTSILIGNKEGIRTPNDGTYKSKISEISGRCGRQNMLRPYLNLGLGFDFRPCSEGTMRP